MARVNVVGSSAGSRDIGARVSITIERSSDRAMANLTKGGRFCRSAALWLKVRALIADTRRGVCPGADLDSVTPWDARWTCRRLRRYRAARFEHGFRDLFRPAGDLRRPEYDYRVGLMRLPLQGSSQETA